MSPEIADAPIPHIMMLSILKNFFSSAEFIISIVSFICSGNFAVMSSMLDLSIFEMSSKSSNIIDSTFVLLVLNRFCKKLVTI